MDSPIKFTCQLVANGKRYIVYSLAAKDMQATLYVVFPSSVKFSEELNLFRYLQCVAKGDTIFVGQYLFTGSETTSVWLEVIFESL